jgi:hypothetical protein
VSRQQELLHSQTSRQPVSSPRIGAELFQGEQQILDRILPTNLRQSLGRGDNAIEQRHLAIYGRQGIGKTNGARWIVEKAVERFGRSQVHVSVAKGEQFRSLLNPNFWNGKPIQIKVLEDLTFAELKDEDLRDFFRIREIMESNTGRYDGLCLVILTFHRFFNTPISLRSDCDSLLALSAPVEEYDSNYLERRIGVDDVNFLAKAEEEQREGAAVLTYRRNFRHDRGFQTRLQIPRINPKQSYMVYCQERQPKLPEGRQGEGVTPTTQSRIGWKIVSCLRDASDLAVRTIRSLQASGRAEYCIACGDSLRLGSKFCPKCGARVSE